MGWLATAALREQMLLRKLLGLPVFETDPSGDITQFLDANGNSINFGLPVYTYGEQPNPCDVPKFTKVGYDPACLTGSGATTLPIEMVSDLVNWRFSSPGQVLYSKSGTVASPLVSGVAAGATTATEVSMWGSLNPIMIPANMLYNGFRGRLQCTLIKTGTTGTWEIWIRIGSTLPGGSIIANDQLFIASSLTNTTGRQYQVDVSFVVTSTGRSSGGSAVAGETIAAFVTKMTLAPNTSVVSASGAADKGAKLDTFADAYININARGSTGDTFSLLDYTFTASPL